MNPRPIVKCAEQTFCFIKQLNIRQNVEPLNEITNRVTNW